MWADRKTPASFDDAGVRFLGSCDLLGGGGRPFSRSVAGLAEDLTPLERLKGDLGRRTALGARDVVARPLRALGARGRCPLRALLAAGFGCKARAAGGPASAVGARLVRTRPPSRPFLARTRRAARTAVEPRTPAAVEPAAGSTAALESRRSPRASTAIAPEGAPAAEALSRGPSFRRSTLPVPRRPSAAEATTAARLPPLPAAVSSTPVPAPARIRHRAAVIARTVAPEAATSRLASPREAPASALASALRSASRLPARLASLGRGGEPSLRIELLLCRAENEDVTALGAVDLLVALAHRGFFRESAG